MSHPSLRASTANRCCPILTHLDEMSGVVIAARAFNCQISGLINGSFIPATVLPTRAA